jgi:hypothetical protein
LHAITIDYSIYQKIFKEERLEEFFIKDSLSCSLPVCSILEGSRLLRLFKLKIED